MVEAVEKAANLIGNLEVDGYDVYFVEKENTNIEVREGKVERIRTSKVKGLAVRLVSEGKLGFAYTNDVSDDGIRIALECARENAKFSEPDDYIFSMPQKSDLDFQLLDDNFDNLSIDRKISLAKEVEEEAFRFDSKIKRTRKSAYAESKTSVYYLNSNNHSFSYTTTSFSLSILVTAEINGSSQMGWGYQSARFFCELNPKLVAVEAADEAVSLLGAKPIKTKKMPVIFKNRVFAELIETLSAGFLGDNVLRGKSLFKDKLDREIASHVLTVYDDPLKIEGSGSCPYDDEGIATRKKAVIERGILKNFLVDTYSAQKLGLKFTGNGIRPSVSSLPKSGITNLVVERGALGLEELVKTPEEVLLVTDAMGLHTINPITGEFSIGVSGLYFVDGKLIAPVTGMTVAGNVKDLLFNITEVGADVKWLGNVASPSVLVKELTVGGE
jgi:PmbA protein